MKGSTQMEETNIQQSEAKATETNAQTDSKNNETTQETVSTSSKTYTAEEFNNAMASIRVKTEKQLAKKFEGVDVEKYNQLLKAEEDRILEVEKQKGNFEKVLKETVSKKDEEITTLKTRLQSQMVDGALISAASKYKAISPEQVKELLAKNVRLNAKGEVEVVGQEGAVRYTDTGDAMTVDTLVKEWLDKNPHFSQPGPKGAGSQSNTSTTMNGQVDVSKLNLENPEHRKIYKEMRDQRLAQARKFI
jgi:hypothetical protein